MHHHNVKINQRHLHFRYFFQHHWHICLNAAHVSSNLVKKFLHLLVLLVFACVFLLCMLALIFQDHRMTIINDKMNILDQKIWHLWSAANDLRSFLFKVMLKSNENRSFEQVWDLTILKYFRHKSLNREHLHNFKYTSYAMNWGKLLDWKYKTTTGKKVSLAFVTGSTKTLMIWNTIFCTELWVFTERNKQLFLQRQTWKSGLTKSQVLQQEVVKRKKNNLHEHDKHSCDLILDEYMCASVLLRRPFYLATLCPFLITCGLYLESYIIRPALKTVISLSNAARGTIVHAQ